MKYPSKLLRKYDIGKPLGEGNFGQVMYATKRRNQQPRAVKIIDKKAHTLSWQRELDVLSLLKHPNIVKYYEHYDNEKFVYIILEYCSGGNLFDAVIKEDCLSEERSKTLIAQLLGALEYCHGNLIAHRDLKPENILLDGRGNLKLADFGFAKHISNSGQTTTLLGSVSYAAIELFTCNSYNPFLADTWSLGVVITVIVKGSFPWCKEEGGTEELLRQNFKSGVCPKLLLDKTMKKEKTSSDFQSLVRQLLNPDPAKRLALDRVKRQPWLLGYFVDSRLPVRDAIPESELDSELLDSVCQLTKISRRTLIKDLTKGRKGSLCFSIYHLLLERQDEMMRPHQIDSGDRTLSGTQLVRKVLKDAPDTPPVLLRKRSSNKKIIRISIL